eukprot:scaffold6456_cov18-Tisochrysis_lutea.AAC.1
MQQYQILRGGTVRAYWWVPPIGKVQARKEDLCCSPGKLPSPPSCTEVRGDAKGALSSVEAQLQDTNEKYLAAKRELLASNEK